MATSKILIDGVGIDLTNDTITSANDIAVGKVGHTKDGSVVTGTFTNDADATAADIQSGKTAYVNGAKITGTGGSTPTQTKSMTLGASAPSTVTPDSGYALSSVSPSIDTSVIKAENIAQGATILGIEGTHSGGGSSVVIGTGKVQDFQFNNVTADFTSCSNFAMVAYLNNLEAFVPGESGYNAFAVVLENGQYYAIGIYSNGRTVKLATVTIADVQTKRIILNFNTLVGSTVAPLQGGSWMIFGW